MRNRFSKVGPGLAASIALATALMAAGPLLAADGTKLRIATEAANPPFTYRDQNGEPQGLEIDLARAFCQAMRADCTFVVRQWEGILRDLLKGEHDAVVSSVAITSRRRARVAFSIPYYRLPSSFIGRKDGPVEAAGKGWLTGRRVGVVEGTPQADYLAAAHPEAEIRPFAKADEAFLDLLAERIDLVLTGKLAAARFLDEREGACCRIVADAPRDDASLGEGVGVALRPADGELKARFDAAIRETIASGTYDRVRARYLPFDIK